MTHKTFVVAAACLFTTIAGAAASAQPPKPPAKAKQPTPDQAPPGPLVEWADEMFHLKSVGLTMHMPLNAKSQQVQLGAEVSVQIVAADKSWAINIRTPVTSNPASTVKEALDHTIALVQGQVGVLDKDQKTVLSTEAKILDRADRLEIPGLPPAARAYIQVPTKDTPIVKGYTFFKPTATQYVLFELLVPEAGFQRAKTIYETTIGTATFADQIEVVAARGSAVKSGVSFFESLTPADYTAAMGKDYTWYRLYTPGAGGAPADATERGYRGIRFWQGKRGEINPDTPRSRWKDTENQDGYLAELSVRLLQDDNIVDTKARFFMSPDRNEEAWSVRMIQRDKAGNKELGRWTETGARLGTDVNVLIQEPGKKPNPVVPFIQGEGYISQVEAYLLPALLSRAAVARSFEGEFAFYTYRSESETIAIRTDTIARDAKAGGVLTISTRFRDDVTPQKTFFNDRGVLIRTELPDGSIWEPTDLQSLERLWRGKGLPTARPKD